MCPVQHGASGDTDDGVPMYTQEFVDDPHTAYREMREKYGSLVPVMLAPGVPATLVVRHETAVRILNDPDHFPTDPRTWQDTIPADSPVRPMMAYLPAARYSNGAQHQRYRTPSRAAIDSIDLHAVPATVEQIARPLINNFCTDGSADLVTQYAFPLVLDVLNHMVGCPTDIGEQVATGMAQRFEGRPEGMKTLKMALMELIRLKREHGGTDVTAVLAEPRYGLDDEEVFAQLMSFYGAGFEAQRNLITNALVLMMTDDRFQSQNVLGRNLSTVDAVDEVLFNDPPMANFCTTYPRQPIMVDGVWLPAHKPVVISLAACNNDPAIRGAELGESSIGNRSHLAWSVGPHACPAQDPARLTVQHAIDQLFDAIPDLTLAVRKDGLAWRPGPFHRALASLPVTFAPSPPLYLG
ncbi:cytochrome P450 [Nocardia blacklockiae]|nr:cytochrome P450 [Nocardia blacklockiae]MBF6174897.1 cytochrome P450 [Nocardia blacklockiae]